MPNPSTRSPPTAAFDPVEGALRTPATDTPSSEGQRGDSRKKFEVARRSIDKSIRRRSYHSCSSPVCFPLPTLKQSHVPAFIPNMMYLGVNGVPQEP